MVNPVTRFHAKSALKAQCQVVNDYAKEVENFQESKYSTCDD